MPEIPVELWKRIAVGYSEWTNGEWPGVRGDLEEVRAAAKHIAGYVDNWLIRRVGYVQGRLIGAGHALGLESEMPPEAQAVVQQALLEFEERWPREQAAT